MIITKGTMANKSIEELEEILKIKTLPNVKKAIVRQALKAKQKEMVQETKTDTAAKDSNSASTKKKAPEKKKEKKVGVIATIFNTIAGSKNGVTKAQILAKLKKAFPDRNEASMAKTINAQIGSSKRPVRMEREKNVTFIITENDDKEKRKYSLKQ